MQLKIPALITFFLAVGWQVKAQEKPAALPGDSSQWNVKQLEAAEVNILFSYYQQDGNHAPVTGGEGTEKLTDLTSRIIVTLPVNDRLTLHADGGFDHYTSASTDKIDRHVSSASSSDTRVHGNFGFTRSNEEKTSIVGLKIGGSAEYDYTSISLGGSYTKLSKDGNTEVGINGQVFMDRWSLIYPEELRRGGKLVPTDKRNAYNLALTYSQVINRRMQLAVSLEGIYMTGLLSTPFHRVYFLEQTQAKVEMLPDNRLKIPLGLRLNYYANDRLLMRFYYRYYWDDWGVNAHTASLEIPVKISRFFSVYPFYRFHTQTASDYFAPFKSHTLDKLFYTSDYDLSELQSHTFGLGVRYSPPNGISNFNLLPGKRATVTFKGIDLRIAGFSRSDGLRSGIASVGFNFSF